MSMRSLSVWICRDVLGKDEGCRVGWWGVEVAGRREGCSLV